jgi:hypothetical protein
MIKSDKYVTKSPIVLAYAIIIDRLIIRLKLYFGDITERAMLIKAANSENNCSTVRYALLDISEYIFKTDLITCKYSNGLNNRSISDTANTVLLILGG